MAVAAYASLVSLTHVLENIHYRAQLHRLTLGVEQIETLQGKVGFLLDFVEVHSCSENQEMNSLWRKMTEVAREVEETIDLHVVDELCRRSQEVQEPGRRSKRAARSRLRKYMCSGSHEIPSFHQRRKNDEECKSDMGIPSFHHDMEGVIQKIDFIMKELSMVEEGTKDIRGEKQPNVPVAASSSIFGASSKSFMVGFDEYVDRILDELTNTKHNLQIIPIVGMGGIGKTTLAQNIFTHPNIVDHFDKCIWITISQNYSVKQILLSLLSKDGREENDDDLSVLGERLHKELLWRRYLIVMDDMWSTDVWDDLKMFFPNNINGSRVMITTRLSDVVFSLRCQNLFKINFLSEDQSWNLFCQKSFAQDCCPYLELEEIGKDIAKSCRGLPLALIVIASLLSKSNMTREYWEFVAENVTSLGNLEDDERCLKILSLSYTNLPIHLKPCFLYTRLYSEDARINVSNMIKLWVAAGFIKSMKNKSLEEIAKEYFNDLVGRNLIFIREWKMNKKPKTCGIHDLLRDLCSRESIKESFTWTVGQWISPYPIGRKCFICDYYLDRNIATENFLELSLISPATFQIKGLVCDACKMTYSNTTRVRVVRAIDINERELHGNGGGRRIHLMNKDVLWYFVQPTQLRYILVDFYIYDLEFTSASRLHLLWNLHTITIDRRRDFPIVVPFEFWEMSQLRHFEVRQALLSYPPRANGKDLMILKNLQTLSTIHNFIGSNKVLERIPNVKILKVDYLLEIVEEGKIRWPKCSLMNLPQLCELESLEVGYAQEMGIIFPISLKKIVLKSCRISWDDINILGSLPNLEILKLKYMIEGSEWNPVEGSFLQLKGLCIIKCDDLEYWIADSIHFPKLEWLILEQLESLVEIPSGIGDIETLHTIRLGSCSSTIVESAKQIWDEQQYKGNESLQIHVIESPTRYHELAISFKSMKIEEDSNDHS